MSRVAVSRWVKRSLAMVVSLATGVGMLSAGSVASATSDVPLTKDITVAAPPSSTFVGATSGDGWDVQFYGSQIFNVFHHNSSSYNIDCHEQSDGSHCSGGASWPKTITDTDGNSFSSPGHATGWVDTATGDFYGWTTRLSDMTGGVVCVDLTSTDADPYCGFTPLTAANGSTLPFGSGIDGGALVGNKMYAIDTAYGTAYDGDLLCFDTLTKAACDGQPFAQAGLASIGASVYDWTAVAGGYVFTVTSEGDMTCFDPSTQETCTGNWPLTGVSGNQAKPFPMQDISGNEIGICIPQPNVVPCYNFDGTTKSTPAALASAIAAGGSWESSTTVGSRIFVAGSNSVVYCYDFGTASACNNFPKSISGSSLLYTVNPDPNRFGCVWTNADSGSSQIQNFDAFTGASGCSGTVRISAAVMIPQTKCIPSAWTSMQIVDPAPADYTSATVDLADNSGTPIPGGTDLPVDGTGTVDLSVLNPPIDGQRPVFGITFVGPTFGSSIVLRFTWASPDDLACTADPPGAPTSASVDSTGNQQATVSWVAPADDGGAPITGYTVTASPGGATCQAAADATSCTVDGLANGNSYVFRVTATNGAGTSVPSDATSSATLPSGPPSAPSAPSVVPGHGTVSVSWLPPADGGSAITGYTVTASPGGATCTATPPTTTCDVTGLTDGTSYTFTVTATNALGTGDASNPSHSATPGDPPSAPAAPSGLAASGSVTVSWTAPDPGTSPITSYRVTASPGGAGCTATAPQTWCTVTGLTNGTGYTFTVTATNATGTSSASPASASVTPAATDADLGVTLTGPTSAARGSTVTYTIVVSNAGPDAAVAVVVTDTLPASAGDPQTTTTGCSITASTLTCTTLSLAASASETITVAVRANDTLDNSASVTSATTDPDSSNNTSDTLETRMSTVVSLPAPPQGSTDSTSQNGDNPSGTVHGSNGALTIDSSGTGGWTIAALPTNPSGTPSRDATPSLGGSGFGGFYSVQLEQGSGFTSTTLRLHGTASSALYWFDGTTWQKVPGVTRDPATGDLLVTVGTGTTPSLADLANAEFAAGATPVTRLGGADRIGTALTVSQAEYPTPGSADAVVIARDDVFADALTGGPLAADHNAPVLLTPSTVLPAAVRTELQRLLLPGGPVYVLGGTSAISAGVANAIGSLGFHVERIAGADRYATAVAIANALGNPSTVFEASGVSFPDALSAGPAAIQMHGVVLLTGSGQQSAATASYLAVHGAGSRYAVGGQADRADGRAVGLVGADRYDTAALVAGRFFTDPSGAGFATGEDFADSMVAVPGLGRDGSPLLLVPGSGSLPTAVAGYLQAHADSIQRATTYGGTKAVSDDVISQVQRATP